MFPFGGIVNSTAYAAIFYLLYLAGIVAGPHIQHSYFGPISITLMMVMPFFMSAFFYLKPKRNARDTALCFLAGALLIPAVITYLFVALPAPGPAPAFKVLAFIYLVFIAAPNLAAFLLAWLIVRCLAHAKTICR